MLLNTVTNIILQNIGYEPTSDQKIIAEKLSSFVLYGNNEQILIIDGHAGTGKTTLIKALVHSLESLKISYELLAPTGRAAKVISRYTNRKALTIHKKIYRQKENNLHSDKYVINYNTSANTVFVVDEASMISDTSFENSIFGSGNLIQDLTQFVFSKAGCKLILIGDSAQLPPVGFEISPALNTEEVKKYCNEVQKFSLKKIVRQAENSGILQNATLIRQNIESKKNEVKLLTNSDVINLSGEELVEKLYESYGKFGIEENIVICRTNKIANKYNQGIRNRVLYREEEISTGDLLMVVKNNYSWMPENSINTFIANGDIIKIVKIYKFINEHGFRFCDASISFADYNNLELRVYLLLDSISADGPSISKEQFTNLYNSVLNDYADETKISKKIEMLKKDKFYNALHVKFAYSVTCHKAQGGQWKNVFIDSGYYPDLKINAEYLKWFYTSVTRSFERIYFINFPKIFFS